jgi:hypothetical protein
VTLSVNVKGGTGAGKRRPKREPGKPWDCKCRRQPGYLLRCPACGKGRP